MNRRRLFAEIVCLCVILLGLACDCSRGEVTYSLTFKEKASGGNLILARTRFYGLSYVSIDTSPGESAESVARRLAEQIMRNHAEKSFSDVHRLWPGDGRPASGASVELAESQGGYFLAGTESGLGIPQAPVFLTSAYEDRTGMVVLKWENPPGAYEAIVISLEWALGAQSARRRVPGDATSFSIDSRNVSANVNDLCVAVVGIRDGIMSGAAAIHISKQYQDEAFVIPFTRGILPNWRAWSKGKGRDAETSLAMGQDYGVISAYVPQDGLDAKPFFQVLRTGGANAVGVYRKFLGLCPGHTYRVMAALSNRELEMKANNEWSFSLHAAPGPLGRDLHVEQLTGEAPLPNGRQGAAAGRVVALGKAKGRRIGRDATGHGFRLLTSKSQTGGLSEDNTDVTLPDGVDVLTVWVRFECSDPNAEVGLMGVGLEDITAARQSHAAPKESPDKSKGEPRSDTQRRSRAESR